MGSEPGVGGRKIRIVLDGLRGETSIAELCRREGIASRRDGAVYEAGAGGHPCCPHRRLEGRARPGEDVPAVLHDRSCRCRQRALDR